MSSSIESDDFWEDWGLSKSEFNKILTENSNAKSSLFGYVAEERFKEQQLDSNPEIYNVRTPDDHDVDDTGDWFFNYRGYNIRVEVKSLKSDSIYKNEDEKYGRFHLKGSSDRRKVKFGEETYQTTLFNTEKTDIDLIAVNLYSLLDEWVFAFIRPCDLPRSEGPYPDDLRQKLSKSSPKVEFPIKEPYVSEIGNILDDIIKDN